MNPSLRAIAVTLLAGGMTMWMIACSEDLPTRPADEPSASAPQADVSIAQIPANDDFDAAVVIAGLPFTESVSTSEATSAADDPPPSCVDGVGHTVWYQFTPSADIRLDANTFGSDYDTVLLIYTGTRGALTEIACNDDVLGLQSRATFDALAGVTYFFMVGGLGEGSGNLVFNLDVAQPLPEIELAFDLFSGVNKTTGVATISGTLTCSRLVSAQVSGLVRDRFGRVRIEASFSTPSFECDGVTRWEAEAAAQQAFVGGKVEVSALAFAFDPTNGDFVSDQASATVHLKSEK